MFYFGTISGSSGAAYNWSGGVSGFAWSGGVSGTMGFPLPPSVKAFYLEPSASGLRFAISPATGFTGFLSTAGSAVPGGVGAVMQAAGTLYGPFYRSPTPNWSIGVYSASATQYSVRVFGAHTT